MKAGKILILQRIVPHYREGFFRKFRERFPGAKIIYGQPSSSESLGNLKNPDKKIFEPVCLFPVYYRNYLSTNPKQ